MAKNRVSRARRRALAPLCESVLGECLRKVDEGKDRLHVPELRDHVMEHPGLHFHFNPDLVIGLHGASRFEFIQERFDIEAGEIAIIPGGIPHREIVQPRREPFENLVVSVYNETVSAQLQEHDGQGGAVAVATEYFDAAKYQQLAQYLEEIAEISNNAGPEYELGIKGLLLVYFSTLQSAIRRVRFAPPVEKLKISQTRQLVQAHLGDSHLSVDFLARQLHCSSDYLSNLFRRETGQRLATHINLERVRAAMTMLRTAPLTVAEVAYATGFESQSYFSRVFKQVTHKTPLDFRRSVEHSVVELEGRPRTIFAGSN
ncbi:MAG TPA: AraC family transcriptional regulator [Candidatus Methylacidiphilales bacterium]|jgi:AraC-like DNA-binding protein|nr:AraC family transcriptional regulator [Candidatus Methylacidiphilales bacterium]